MNADQRVRQALDEAQAQLRAGWTVDQVAAVLADAEKVIADVRAHEYVCAWCGETVTGEQIRDAIAVSWLGDGAATYCSTTCKTAHDEAEINAAGGTS